MTQDLIIPGLHEIGEESMEKLVQLYMAAYVDYPKLDIAYPDLEDRLAAREMTVRYYLSFDAEFGRFYSLDDDINECVTVIHSDEMDFTEERCREADCEGEGFSRAAAKLSPENRQKWWDFFEEFDRCEAALDIPRPHIYADFVAVRPGMQGQGRGTKIMKVICDYADSIGLPVMLFTNTDEDIKFYKKLGFRILDITRSEEYGFVNTYMIYGA